LKSGSWLLVAVIVVAVVGGGVYYTHTMGSPKTPSSKSQTVDLTIVGGIGVGTEDTYVPDNFTVTEGNNVTLVIENTDDNTHGLGITQFGVNSGIILPGDTVRVSFIANETGIFKYQEPAGDCKGGYGGVCNSVQHMWGYITVAAP
jgi:heme/copper-type cytochrome/quinol oxidase subunit 2